MRSGQVILANLEANSINTRIKRSLAPKVERGFHVASADLSAQRRVVVYPGAESYPLGPGIQAMPLSALGGALLADA